MNTLVQKNKIAIVGASGYTGSELLRLLSNHPSIKIISLAANKNAGRLITDIFPHLSHLHKHILVQKEEIDWSNIDLVFCCLPHSTSHEFVSNLPNHLKIIDLSADFRLKNINTYAEWYGCDHLAPDCQEIAVYGVPELARDNIKTARLLANPGCYPTSVLLPLIPLFRENKISTANVIIDSKSGATGAGRVAKEELLFSEVSEGIHAYGVASHRHVPEIEQELSFAANNKVVVNFTPHLMPMNRGILSTIYVELNNNISVSDIHDSLQTKYNNEPFVHILSLGKVPHTKHVRGSNSCLIGVVKDRLKNRVIIVSVIDNLVKGASGQAIQNMNLMLGLDEISGLNQVPLFP